MSNMSYCRFENTLSDLEDCLENLHEDDISSSEKRARDSLIETCQEIIFSWNNRDSVTEEE